MLANVRYGLLPANLLKTLDSKSRWRTQSRMPRRSG